LYEIHRSPKKIKETEILIDIPGIACSSYFKLYKTVTYRWGRRRAAAKPKKSVEIIGWGGEGYSDSWIPILDAWVFKELSLFLLSFPLSAILSAKRSN